MILHAGLIARRLGGAWAGVLIEGPSGAGKSDLALRSLAQGFRLVADDRVLVWTSGARLFGRAPETLSGLVEARGLGVIGLPTLGFCEVTLVAVCGPQERLPDPAWAVRLGLRLPMLGIAPLEASAPAKLACALDHLGARRQPAYLGPAWPISCPGRVGGSR